MLIALVAVFFTSCADSDVYGLDEKIIEQPAQPSEPIATVDTIVSVTIDADYSLVCVDSTDYEAGASFKYEGKGFWWFELKDGSSKKSDEFSWNFNTTLSWTPERFIIRENEKISLQGVTVNPVSNGINAVVNFDQNLSFDVKARTEMPENVKVEGFEVTYPTVKCVDIKVLEDEISYTELAQEAVSGKLMDCWFVEIPCLAIYDNGDAHRFVMTVKIGKGAYVEPDQPNVPDTPDPTPTPEEPETPVTPEEPETPVTPEEPETPVTPEEPETPVTPEEPETPVTPEEPETPVTPEEPETPVTPEEPETPVTPEEPETPVTPEEPETPAQPSIDVYVPSQMGSIISAVKTTVIRGGDVKSQTTCLSIICANGVYANIDGSWYTWMGTSAISATSGNGSWQPADIQWFNGSNSNDGWLYMGNGATQVSKAMVITFASGTPMLGSYSGNADGTITIDGVVYGIR